MKSHTHYHWFNTKQRQEIIDITDTVAEQDQERRGGRRGARERHAHHRVGVRQRSRVGAVVGYPEVVRGHDRPVGAGPLPAQRDGRGQRGGPPAEPHDRARGDRAGHGRQAGLRPVAAGVLRGVGRAAKEAGDHQGAGGVSPPVADTSTRSVTQSGALRYCDLITHWRSLLTHRSQVYSPCRASTFQQSNVPAGTVTACAPTTRRSTGVNGGSRSAMETQFTLNTLPCHRRSSGTACNNSGVSIENGDHETVSGLALGPGKAADPWKVLALGCETRSSSNTLSLENSCTNANRPVLDRSWCSGRSTLRSTKTVSPKSP